MQVFSSYQKALPHISGFLAANAILQNGLSREMSGYCVPGQNQYGTTRPIADCFSQEIMRGKNFLFAKG
jgi:hypothetical protein